MQRRSNFVLDLPLLGTVALVFGMLTRAAAQSPDYLDAIHTLEEFELVSTPSTLPGETQRLTKFLLPASTDPALLHPVFQNVNRYPFHMQFMSTVFPDFFPGLDRDVEYQALVLSRASRRYFAGALGQLDTSQGTVYGFTVYSDEMPGEFLRVDEIEDIYKVLSGIFSLTPLAYAPTTAATRALARDWDDPGFPVYLGGALSSTYQAYNLAVGYGHVRILTSAEFEQANNSCGFSFQDILILEQSPFDIDGVVGGVITENTQSELSHIFLRTANRGTPNAFLADATKVFKPLEGQLIRMEVTAREYFVKTVELDEALAWWSENRPSLSAEPLEDVGYSALDSLEEMDIGDGAPMPAVSRFGGKASNFARLQQRIMTGELERYKEKGFGVPLHYYRAFMQANRTASPLNLNPIQQVTYEEYLQELFSMPEFQSDTQVRCRELDKFRKTVEDSGVVDPALVSQLIDRIGDVFGSTRIPVRFRSSSNVEDGLEFNGAGLYDSTGACADDNLDGDDAGPSLCDPSKSKERTIERALRRVWASLWTFRAYEERNFFQISQDKVSMALLVSRSFLDEDANAVAFTGNPANALDPRYLVIAQVGEESVVHPDPSIRAEKNVIEIDDSGNVDSIERPQRSSILPDGRAVVFSDAKLTELASILWAIDQRFPVELGAHDRNQVLFDTEVKIEPSGELAMKQVRPFLLPEITDEGPTFELEVPPDTVVCGVFADARSLEDEYALKSQMRLRAGVHELRAAEPRFDGNLIEELLLGPDQVLATSTSPGRFSWDAKTSGNGSGNYTFKYVETFSLPGGEEVDIRIVFPDFQSLGAEEPAPRKTVDDEFITEELTNMTGQVGSLKLHYSSCSYETLQLWEGRVELASGDLIQFEERYRPPQVASGPANIVSAHVDIGGVQRDVRDYWRLVYSALHHNVRVKYWIVLDPPMQLRFAGIGEVHVVEVHAESSTDPARVYYLDTTFSIISTVEVICYQKARQGELGSCNFLRGDADSNGRVNLTDAIFVVRRLFQGGSEPTCGDAADFDDDGVLSLTDVILTVAFLFQGVDLSQPPGPFECGPDPSDDDLGECKESSCR